MNYDSRRTLDSGSDAGSIPASSIFERTCEFLIRKFFFWTQICGKIIKVRKTGGYRGNEQRKDK